MGVTLTQNAISKIREIYSQDKDLTGKSLRVAIEAGGCSSYQYAFKFDKPNDNDIKQDYEGFSLLIDKESDKVLTGSTIDYKEDFGSEGFAIKNPNAKKSCGCGNSFDT